MSLLPPLLVRRRLPDFNRVLGAELDCDGISKQRRQDAYQRAGTRKEEEPN